MEAAAAQPVAITPDGAAPVSGLLQAPPEARACYVLAHGAGAGMTHPFMAAVADGLAQRGIATLRYQFPYMERGSKRPDPPALAHADGARRGRRGRAAAAALPLFAGGKSFGGRMTSQAQARVAAARRARPRLPRLSAAPGRASRRTSAPSTSSTSRVPMLFLQGTRDELAELDLLRAAGRAARRARDAAAVRRTPTTPSTCRRAAAARDADVLAEMLDALAAWIEPLAR